MSDSQTPPVAAEELVKECIEAAEIEGQSDGTRTTIATLRAAATALAEQAKMIEADTRNIARLVREIVTHEAIVAEQAREIEGLKAEAERLIRVSGVGLAAAAEAFERQLQQEQRETAAAREDRRINYDLYISARAEVERLKDCGCAAGTCFPTTAHERGRVCHGMQGTAALPPTPGDVT